MSEGLTPSESVNAFFDRGAELIHLKDEMYDVLKTSYREISVQVPVRMDSGEPTLINAAIDPTAGSESGRIGNLNPQSVVKKK